MGRRLVSDVSKMGRRLVSDVEISKNNKKKIIIGLHGLVLY